jgi:hypothetical protein
MTVKASGRSALILATGLFVCFAGPSPATAAGTDRAAATSKSDSATPKKYVRQGARHAKRYARRSGKVASKPAETRKAAEKDVADASTDSTLTIPASVANANAQLASAEAPAGSAQAMTEKANTILLAAADKPAEAQPDRPGGFLRSAQRRRSGPAAEPGHADGGDGGAQTRGAGAGFQQSEFDLGRDLADRKDLHRLRCTADDGFRRAHVHGVRCRIAGCAPDAAKCVRAASFSPLEAHPASGHIARDIRHRGGPWLRSNSLSSRARARSASSR